MSNQGLSIFDHEPDDSGDEPTQVIPTAKAQSQGTQKTAQKVAETAGEAGRRRPRGRAAGPDPQRQPARRGRRPGAPRPAARRQAALPADRASRRLRHRGRRQAPAHPDRREGRPRRQPDRGTGAPKSLQAEVESLRTEVDENENPDLRRARRQGQRDAAPGRGAGRRGHRGGHRPRRPDPRSRPSATPPRSRPRPRPTPRTCGSCSCASSRRAAAARWPTSRPTGPARWPRPTTTSPPPSARPSSSVSPPSRRPTPCAPAPPASPRQPAPRPSARCRRPAAPWPSRRSASTREAAENHDAAVAETKRLVDGGGGALQRRRAARPRGHRGGQPRTARRPRRRPSSWSAAHAARPSRSSAPPRSRPTRCATAATPTPSASSQALKAEVVPPDPPPRLDHRPALRAARRGGRVRQRRRELTRGGSRIRPGQETGRCRRGCRARGPVRRSPSYDRHRGATDRDRRGASRRPPRPARSVEPRHPFVTGFLLAAGALLAWWFGGLILQASSVLILVVVSLFIAFGLTPWCSGSPAAASAEWRGTIVRSCSECDDMDTNERTVLFGLTTIITVCGAVLLWVHRQSGAPMDFIERHLGFSPDNDDGSMELILSAVLLMIFTAWAFRWASK